MGKNRQKKSNSKKPQKSHSKQIGFASLNPDFDAANEAILDSIYNELSLVCDRCAQEYDFDPDWVDCNCPDKDCDGWLDVYRGAKKVINLPESIKNGTAWGSSGASSQSSWSTQSWGHGSGYHGSSYKACEHLGDKVIFELDGKKIYASNSHSIDEWSGKWNLIIDLAGVVQIPNTVVFVSNTAPERFRKLSKFTLKEKELPSEILRLHWTDMGVPPVGLQFWRELWSMLPEKTVVACFGGHGRTGTCLAAMMITNGVDYYSAVETVRTDHCSKAIETYGQEVYLHKLWVEVLEGQLSFEQSQEKPDEKLIKDIMEDISYALANKPSIGNEVKKSTGVTVWYGPKTTHNVKAGTELAEALKAKRPVKTIDDQIYIEECNDPYCTTVSCDKKEHQQWVKWEGSTTKVELDFILGNPSL